MTPFAPTSRLFFDWAGSTVATGGSASMTEVK